MSGKITRQELSSQLNDEIGILSNLTTTNKTSLVEAVNETAERLEDKANRAELTPINKELQKFNNIMVASWHGVDSSIGTVDATTVLNNLFALAKSDGRRYVYFDDPHIYNANGDLTNARDLILIGSGAKIKSNNLKNYFIQISDGFDTYNGKYNSFSETDLLFKAAATAIKAKQVNVTLWGDSISTGGTDVIGIKYNITSSGSEETSPQGLTAGDSYYIRLIDMLTAKFPDVAFNFYNRAVGGTAVQSWNSNQTFNGVSKTWSEHVKDTNPDILILGFGMNTDLTMGKTFRFSMDSILNYIETNFTKKPSVCWVTTPRPSMAIGDSWGSIDSQISRHLAAYTTRYSGRLKGGYVIDAGKISDIKRIGTDFSNPIMKTIDVTGLTSGSSTENNGVYTFDQDGKTLVIGAKASDFSMEFEFSVTGGTQGNGNLWFGYNSLTSPALESAALFFPNFNGTANIQSFANFLDVGNYTVPKQKADTISWADGTWKSVRIEKRAEILNIYINGIRLIRDVVAINNIPGNLRFLTNGTGTAVYKIRNIKLRVGSYKRYLPTLTEREMWGDHVDADYTTKPEIGGNGVNHPSTIGIEDVYCTVLREFVDDLAMMRWKYLIV